MGQVFEQVYPLAALGLVSFLIIVAATVFFVPRQRAREFTMLTIPKVVGLAAVSSALAAFLESLTETSVPLSHLAYLAAATALGVLLGVSILTDFKVHKIPTETAWMPAFVGVVGFIVVAFICGCWSFDVDRLFVLMVLAIFPIISFFSILFGGGGAADFRVSAAGFLATFWWVSPGSIFFGLLAFAVFTVIGRVFFSKKNDKGKTMTPAGPAYVSMFAVAAFTTLISAV